MQTNTRNLTSFSAGVLLTIASCLFAQNGSAAPPQDPLGYEDPTHAINARETNAFKSFQSIPDTQFDKKVKSGEDFIKKFSNSSYLPQVYSTLSVLYIQNNQPDKGFADGEKALELRPNDIGTMANLAQAMARLNNPNDPQAAEKLQKAQGYAQKSIQLAGTLPKPADASDQQFAALKNQVLAMAHGALGLIAIRQGKYSDAIPDLQQATQLDASKDPTNFYLLGVANQNSSHYAEAIEAYNKCAASPGNLQQTCRDGAAQAQKSVVPK